MAPKRPTRVTEPQGVHYSVGSGPQGHDPESLSDPQSLSHGNIHSNDIYRERWCVKNQSKSLADGTFERPEHDFPVGKLQGNPNHLQALWSREAGPGGEPLL